MRFIDKAKAENRIKGLAINRQILKLCWNEKDCKYTGLNYNDVDKSTLIEHIVVEQDCLCCYCMRNLHIKSEGNHRKNVTLEHVIPHKIKEQDWFQDRGNYRIYPLLRDNHITVCFEGDAFDNGSVNFNISSRKCNYSADTQMRSPAGSNITRRSIFDY